MKYATLTKTNETVLAQAIEAGLLAQEALEQGHRPFEATKTELQLISQAGLAAWHQFLLANIGLVRMVARSEARRSGLAEDDLTQEGFVALGQALRRYDYLRGRFSTFALPRIRHQVAQAAASRLGGLGLPPSAAILRRRALAIAGRLDQQRQRPTQAFEVSDEIGRSTSWTSRILNYNVPLSLSDVYGAEREIAAPAVSVIHQLELDEVSDAIAALPKVEQTIIRLRYGFTELPPQSYAAVASYLKMSPSGVRRTERHGLAILRQQLGVGRAGLEPTPLS